MYEVLSGSIISSHTIRALLGIRHRVYSFALNGFIAVCPGSIPENKI